MDLYRAFLAIVLSFIILIGYQYYFVKPVVQEQSALETPTQSAPGQPQESGAGKIPGQLSQPASAAAQFNVVPVDPDARDIIIETPLYSAVINEQGGGFKSFILKKYRMDMAEDSGPMELIEGGAPAELPMLFSLDNGTGSVPVFKADKEKVSLTESDAAATLKMTAELPGGIRIVRTLMFDAASYLVDISYQLENTSDVPVQVSPAMTLNNKPFPHASSTSRYLFSGPSVYINEKLEEIKTKKLADGPRVLQGKVSWAGYVDNYFICSVVPPDDGINMVSISGSTENVRIMVSQGIINLPARGTQDFNYRMYFGPKKLTILQGMNYDLGKAVNFGWFDFLAKPMLWLLNFFNDYVRNYGVAIILVTVLIKAVFWPITQKGMKSMKNMQKLQPKVAKLKEKFKDDPAKMNQEMMAMYKTYKVNPVGGCLPMLIQIPFFFALYRVLMAAIELRHAPFMLWINDLSAPDRLWIGVDIPYLHGIPVLTLLMGASMYLQQKMTPTTADPTQAKIMQFLPIIFTFMFINFASGLVLYWFVNNLLSILQQQLINRQLKA
ncbi:MAG: membrane protein insertase YidC [Desulfobulbaceae bacterium]|nr:membrane protein insertase YidC [Desulfobulbaceae bacterium]